MGYLTQPRALFQKKLNVSRCGEEPLDFGVIDLSESCRLPAGLAALADDSGLNTLPIISARD